MVLWKLEYGIWNFFFYFLKKKLEITVWYNTWNIGSCDEEILTIKRIYCLETTILHETLPRVFSEG
jgi:hypothetical protein